MSHRSRERRRERSRLPPGALRGRRHLAMYHRAGRRDCATSARDLVGRGPAQLANRFDLQSEAVHVALGEIPAARVERGAPVGSDEVVEREHLVRGLVGAEPVLDERHHHSPGEVLVRLHHVDVVRANSCLRPHARRQCPEPRTCVVGIVVRGCTGAEPAALCCAEKVDRPLREVTGTVCGDEHHRRGPVVLETAVVQAVRLDDPPRLVVLGRSEGSAVHHRPRVLLGVVVGGECDGAHRRTVDTVQFEKSCGAHREHLGRRHHPRRGR